MNGIKLKGIVVTKVIRNGEVIREDRKENTIVLTGIQEIVKFIANQSATGFSYIAIGSDNTTPSINDTSLYNEIARLSATTEITSTDYTNDTAKFTAVFDITAPTTVGEVGIFNASTGGVMLARIAYATPYSLDAGDKFQVEYYIKVGGA